MKKKRGGGKVREIYIEEGMECHGLVERDFEGEFYVPTSVRTSVVHIYGTNRDRGIKVTWEIYFVFVNINIIIISI